MKKQNLLLWGKPKFAQESDIFNIKGDPKPRGRQVFTNTVEVNITNNNLVDGRLVALLILDSRFI